MKYGSRELPPEVVAELTRLHNIKQRAIDALDPVVTCHYRAQLKGDNDLAPLVNTLAEECDKAMDAYVDFWNSTFKEKK